jgi:hypothetical protein
VIVSRFPYPFHFTTEDMSILPVGDLANNMRVSRAFVRLCVVAGCPWTESGTSAARLLVWLFDHYEQVRAIAGLQTLASVDGLPTNVVVRLRMANALVTLLEFTRSRATNWRQKKQLRKALERVHQLADRAS